MSEFISEFIKKKKLGQILVNKGLVSEEQVLDCLDIQENTREFLGEILVNKGYINEEVLYRVLSEQLQMDYYSYDAALKIINDVNAKGIETKLPMSFLKQHKIFILNYMAGVLDILTSDPLNLTLKDQISIMTKSEVKYSICTKTSALKLVEILKKRTISVGRKIIEEALRSPANVVDILCQKCDKEMIFVLSEIAKKHKDAIARRAAIKKLRSFNEKGLIFVFNELLKSEMDMENRKNIQIELNILKNG